MLYLRQACFIAEILCVVGAERHRSRFAAYVLEFRQNFLQPAEQHVRLGKHRPRYCQRTHRLPHQVYSPGIFLTVEQAVRGEQRTLYLRGIAQFLEFLLEPLALAVFKVKFREFLSDGGKLRRAEFTVAVLLLEFLQFTRKP